MSIEEITIKQTIIALVVAMIVSVAIMVLPNLKFAVKRDEDASPRKIPLIVGAIMFVATLVSGIYVGNLVNTAVAHGLYSTDLPIAPLKEQVRLSHEDQSQEFGEFVEENGTPTDTVVVMYRLTCHDCESVFEDLDSELRAMNVRTFWVSSRSSIGTQLRDMYDVVEVPALIIFDSAGRASVSRCHMKDAAGNTVLDPAVMEIAKKTLHPIDDVVASEDAADDQTNDKTDAAKTEDSAQPAENVKNTNEKKDAETTAETQTPKDNAGETKPTAG